MNDRIRTTCALLAGFAAFAAALPRCGFAAPTTVTARVATNIAEHVTARDAFTTKTDRDGNRTALTVGTRRDGAAVGRGSATVGEDNEASWQGAFAQGHGTVAGAEHSVAMGHAANATNVDSFAWNGDSDVRYGAHGRGTFNVNPIGGAKGVWIGDRTLDELIDQKGGIATDFLTKTNAADFVDVSPSSIVGRVTNEDVRISVTNETLTIWDRTNRVWSSESSGNAVALLTKTNAADFASVAPSSIVWRVTNEDVMIAVSNETLRLSDGTNVVWESRAVTNDVYAAVTNEVGGVKEIVFTWERFLDGSNVVFAITNYISGTYNLNEAKLKIQELKEVEPGVTNYVTVYNSRDEIILHQTNFNETVVQPGFTNLSDRIDAATNWVERTKAPKDWGRFASDGTEAPSNTVVIRAPSTVFAGGYGFDRVNVGSGTIGVLVNRGAAAYTGEPGTFRFRDFMTGEYFGYVKNTYTIGVNTDGIQVDQATHMVTLTYNITMSSYPIVKYMPDLDDYDPDEWEPLNDVNGDPLPGASHEVVWEYPDPAPGVKVCHINVGTEPQGFFTAEIAGISGDCRFESNMTAEFRGGFVARDVSDTNVTFAVEAYVDGGEVKWRVK